jgi:branched-subunit amino acid transport protein
MTATITLLLAAVATWLLRIGFITLVPAELLPGRVRLALDDVAPAVMAALLVTHLANGQGLGGLVLADVLAALVAAAVAWRTRQLSATVVVGIAAAGLFRLLLSL